MLRGPRQARLPSDDEDDALAERWANYRLLRKTYLSATALASYAYCNVKPFIQRVIAQLGLDHATPQMHAGALAHEEFQKALTDAAVPSQTTLKQALERGEFLLAVEHPLRDDRRMLRGIVDVAFAKGSEAYLLELKNATPPTGIDETWSAPVRYEHGLQLQFYGLLAAREFRRTPRLALTYLQGPTKASVLDGLRQGQGAEQAVEAAFETSVRLASGPATLEHVDGLIRSFRKDERRFAIPVVNHADPGRCEGCQVRRWCPRRLDRPGRFEPLAADLLVDNGRGT